MTSVEATRVHADRRTCSDDAAARGVAASDRLAHRRRGCVSDRRVWPAVWRQSHLLTRRRPSIGDWIAARPRRRTAPWRDRGSSAWPACSSRPHTLRPPVRRSSRNDGANATYFVASTPSGRCCWRCRSPKPRRRLAPRRGDDRRLRAAGRLQRAGARAGGRLEVPRSSRRSGSASRCSASSSWRPAIPAAGSARSPGSALADLRRGRPQTALVAYLLLLAGLAAKIGWAPVHNWLPDAHCEAPPPVSALLSAALLPAVLLVAWRSEQRARPGRRASDGAGGVARLRARVAGRRGPVPLAAPARGSGCSPTRASSTWASSRSASASRTPLAPAGVVDPHRRARPRQGARLLRRHPAPAHEPRAAGHAVTGIARTQRTLGTTLGISLGTLAGLPPSPLFVSEVLIVAGGFAAGRPGRPAPRASCSRSGSSAWPTPCSRRPPARAVAATARTRAGLRGADRCSRLSPSVVLLALSLTGVRGCPARARRRARQGVS